MYIPSKLFVAGNATATVNNIAAHEWLFRFGIVADLGCGVILIFLVLAFYRLFKGVDRNLAVLVVILGGVMPALIDFLNTVNDGGALMAVRGADFLSVFDKPQRDALAMLFLRLHHQAIEGAEILWGAVATSVRDACMQIAFAAPVSGSLAHHQRLGLCGH
jgi:Domain of unknown function (DUF4386)